MPYQRPEREKKFQKRLIEELYKAASATKSPHIMVALADAYAAAGDIDSGISLLRSSLLDSPNNRVAKVMLAELLYKKDQVDEAFDILESVVEKWPDNPAAVYLLSKIFTIKGQYKKAFDITDKLFCYYPNSKTIKMMKDVYKENYLNFLKNSELDKISLQDFDTNIRKIQNKIMDNKKQKIRERLHSNKIADKEIEKVNDYLESDGKIKKSSEEESVLVDFYKKKLHDQSANKIKSGKYPLTGTVKKVLGKTVSKIGTILEKITNRTD